MPHRFSRDRIALVIGVAMTVAVLCLYAWRTVAVERVMRDQARAINEVVENQREMLSILRAGR